MFETTCFALRDEVNFNSMNNNDITFHVGDRVIVGEDGGGQEATIVCEYGDHEFMVIFDGRSESSGWLWNKEVFRIYGKKRYNVEITK